MNLFWCKANDKRFGFDNLHQDFDIMRIVHEAMDIKVLMKIIKGEMFNVGFTSK